MSNRHEIGLTRLVRLAINAEGFVFDPQTGESFTVNETGRFLLERLREDPDEARAARLMAERFEVSPQEAGADVRDFLEHMRVLRLTG